MKDDRNRLLDILEAIDRIERYTSRGRSDLEADEFLHTWVVHHVQILGEAARIEMVQSVIIKSEPAKVAVTRAALRLRSAGVA